MEDAARPRIGLLGGTFDPVHVAHLVVAVEVRHALALDRVLLVVANRPWQKEGTRPISPAADRLAVVGAAVAGVSGLEASSLEMERAGPTFTADTVAEVARRHPGAAVHVVVGADVAGELDSWVRVDEVRAGSDLVVVGRPGVEAPLSRLEGEGWRVHWVPVPALEVSSTDIRRRLEEGRPVDFLVPEAAIREIRRRGMYAPGG